MRSCKYISQAKSHEQQQHSAISARRPAGWLLTLLILLTPIPLQAWPGHDWNEWKEIATCEPPDIPTDQAGRRDLAPLLEKPDGTKIHSPHAWEQKRNKYAKVIRKILGQPSTDALLPPTTQPAPEVEILGEETLPNHIRRHIRIRTERNDWIPAYVLLPKPQPARPVPAMICLHQTANQGKQEIVGFKGRPEMAFALELVRRGYVCIAPDVIGFGERTPPDSPPYTDNIKFFRQHPAWSCMGKMNHDVSRVVDYLQTLPQVDTSRIGSLGHSHGAYGTLFATAFEPRISLAIASCGFTTFRSDPRPDRWSHLTPLMPQLGLYLPEVKDIPFDWHHVCALIAPKPLFVWYGLKDNILPNTDNLDDLFRDVRNVYALYDAEENLQWHAFDGPHGFPEHARSLAYDWLDAQFSQIATLRFKDKFLTLLAKQVPTLLETFDESTGHFGEGIWICRDQNRMYPLAVAYAMPGKSNPYHKDRRLLDVIVKAGDALIEDADENGQWVFRKKDGSTWGKIWMPWTYSRWIRAYALIRDDMPPDRREAWSRALTLGYKGISRSHLHQVHNIPAHHAMGLYLAGKTLNRPEWCDRATKFLHKVIDAQSEGGYWSEHAGPVVGYNFVYTDALGTYYAVSGDERVLPALKKAAVFHYRFRYPDGSRVETIDERNPYKTGADAGNVGFTFNAVGRTYLAEQWSRIGHDNLSPDLLASLVLYSQEGPTAIQRSKPQETFVLHEGGDARAATIRQGPWFICLSAYTAPVLQNRWIQDRQNVVSIYHDRVGVILGGGNTKLQPAWSNFTVGETNLLKHQPGDTSPDFAPKGELYHTPSAVRLVTGDDLGLDLTVGPETCRIRVASQSDNALEYRVETTLHTDLPTTAHLTLIPDMHQPIATAGGQNTSLGEASIDWNRQQVGGALTHAGYRLTLPDCASVHWPALPHNPYRKDGHATPPEGRIEIRIPFDHNHTSYTVTIEITK